MTTSNDEMKGRRVRVRWRVPGVHKKPRECVGMVMEWNDEEIVLSLRPKAGTTPIKRAHIMAVWETKAPIKLPEPVPDGETRLL